MIDEIQATYDAATQAIEAVEAMERTAAEEPLVTITLPIKAAIEALAAIAIKLGIEEESLNDRFREKGLPGIYARAEIAKLRIAEAAFRAGFKALDEPSTDKSEAK